MVELSDDLPPIRWWWPLMIMTATSIVKHQSLLMTSYHSICPVPIPKADFASTSTISPLIKATHFMHFRSWQTRPWNEKGFRDGLLYSTCRKLKKQGEMLLPMPSPVPSLNSSCYRWDGICMWVMAFPFAPCFLRGGVWLQRPANIIFILRVHIVLWGIYHYVRTYALCI